MFVTTTVFLRSDVNLVNPLGTNTDQTQETANRDDCCRRGWDINDDLFKKSCSIDRTEEEENYFYDAATGCRREYDITETFYLDDAETEVGSPRITPAVD